MMRYFTLFVFSLVSAIVLAHEPTELKSGPDCPLPFRRVGDACLCFNTINTGTWHDMVSFCKYLNGDLVKIDDANLLYEIDKFIYDEQLSPDYFWIGVSDEANEGDWRWLDGTKTKMGTPFWGTTGLSVRPQPQEPQGGTISNCGGIGRQFMFYIHDYRCTKHFYAICQIPWQS